jgi:endonuclease YncB( thermonuclease family)
MTIYGPYPATVDHVIDGDSIMLAADLGWDITLRQNVRLLGLNARELSEPGGKEARDHLTALLPPGTPVTLVSHGWDKYGGRTDGTVILPAIGDVGTFLIAGQWAAAWDGSGSRPVPPWPRTVEP